MLIRTLSAKPVAWWASLFALVVLSLLIFSVDIVRAVTPAAGYGSSSSIASTPNNTFLYAITATSTAQVGGMAMKLPANAVATNPHAWSTVGPGSVYYRAATREYVFTLAKPVRVALGTRISVWITGATTPTPGTYAAAIRTVSPTGAILAKGNTGNLIFTAPPACPTTGWPTDYIATENRRTGTAAWKPTAVGYNWNNFSAYVDKTSLACGQSLQVRINTPGLDLVNVETYRMGYYSGQGGRLVSRTNGYALAWQQPAPLFVQKDSLGRQINMVSASNFARSVTVPITSAFTPGDYVVKVSDRAGRNAYAVFVVRDDKGTHEFLTLNSEATWQAYNNYGGYSAYTAPAGALPSTKVSYDRPNVRDFGTGNFLSWEYGWVFWAESQGLDIKYLPDSDLNSAASQLATAKTIVLMTHGEYWSVAMRNAVDQAVAKGENLMNLGANNIYWRINLGSSPSTGANREFEIFRTGNTARFRDGVNPNPEQNLLGAMYGCLGDGTHQLDGTATKTNNWLWKNVPYSTIPHMARGEVDEMKPDFSIPSGASVLTSVPVTNCRNAIENHSRQDIVAVQDQAVGSTKGRVFDASTQAWVCSLGGKCPWADYAVGSVQTNGVRQMMLNVINWIRTGTTAPVTSSRLDSKKSVNPLIPIPAAQKPAGIDVPLDLPFSED